MRGWVSVVALREKTDTRISNIPMSNSNDTYFLRHFDMHYCIEYKYRSKYRNIKTPSLSSAATL